VRPYDPAVRRRLLNLLTAQSLLLCVAVGVLWVRSHYGVDGFTYYAPERRYILRTAGGRFSLEVAAHEIPWYVPRPESRWGEHWPGRDRVRIHMLWQESVRSRAPTRRDHFGYWWSGLRDPTPAGPLPWFVLVGPIWPLLPPFAILPALWLVRQARVAARRQRARGGRCAACGYDLRATPGRCPECGTTAAPQETVAPPPPAR